MDMSQNWMAPKIDHKVSKMNRAHPCLIHTHTWTNTRLSHRHPSGFAIITWNNPKNWRNLESPRDNTWQSLGLILSCHTVLMVELVHPLPLEDSNNGPLLSKSCCHHWHLKDQLSQKAAKLVIWGNCLKLFAYTYNIYNINIYILFYILSIWAALKTLIDSYVVRNCLRLGLRYLTRTTLSLTRAVLKEVSLRAAYANCVFLWNPLGVCVLAYAAWGGPLHGHIFSFMCTPFPSWAHLPLHGHIFPFMGTSSPSWAHLRHIFPFLKRGLRSIQ